jgi:hypothetical protein
MAQMESVITDAFVMSHMLIARGLDDSQRRLETALPILVTPAVADSVAIALRRGQADIGSKRRKGGGNTTRRLRIDVTVGRLPPDGQSVPDFLTGAKVIGPITDADLLVGSAAVAGDFEHGAIVDERLRVLAAIIRRQGAPQFRRILLDCYERRCAISRCDAEPVLEAAHIVPYAGRQTNHSQNGLLLRADLHTLFDRGLLGVAPETFTVILHPTLARTDYGILAGQPIHLPSKAACLPSQSALWAHLVGTGLSGFVQAQPRN